jgi:hypothetical protein
MPSTSFTKGGAFVELFGGVDSGLRRKDGGSPLSREWESVRSDEVETLDGVGGEGDGSQQVIYNRQVRFA